MGTSSSTPRRVTVVNEDNSGVIRISDSVVKKLKGELEIGSNEQHTTSRDPPREPPISPSSQQHSEPGITNSLPMDTLLLRQKHDQELRDVTNLWKKQKEELEKQNMELWKTTRQNLDDNLTDLESKYVKKQRCDPVCPEAEIRLLDCYKKNSKMPLKCSREAEEFVNCVNSVRNEILRQKKG